MKAQHVLKPLAIVGGSIALGLLIGLVGPSHELIPIPVLADALPLGAISALYAVGLVLVYRAARIINFAHASFGIVASVIFLTLQAEGWSWWAAAPAGLAAAIIAGVLLEVTVLRRFAAAPRLVLTVVTIAASQVLVTVVYLFPQWRFGVDMLSAESQDDLALIPSVPASSPMSDLGWMWDPVRITGDHVFAVAGAAAALVALGAFLRWSTTGMAVRAASESTERVGMLGISTGRLGTIVWGSAAALAGLAAMFNEPLSGRTLAASVVLGGTGSGALLRALAAAVVAKLENLPTAVAAAIGIAILERCVFWAYNQSTFVDIALLVLIGATLALQRRSMSRAETSVTGGWAAADEVRPVPAALAAHPTVRIARRWVVAVGAIVVIGYPFAMSPSQVYLGATYAIFGMVGISLVVLTGWGGQISLGQFALVAVGAISAATASATWGLPFLPALLVAIVAGAVVAVALGLPALRIRGLFLAVTTMAFAIALSGLMADPERIGRHLPTAVDRPALLFLSFEDDRSFYFLSLGGLVLTFVLAKRLRNTRTGRVLIAMRDNERAAQSFSLSLLRVRLVTFAVAGAIAGAAGALLVYQQHGVRIQAFAPERSLEIFLMAVIGGLGSVGGVLTGAIYLGTARTLLPDGAGSLLASGIGVLAVLIFFPQGLGGLLYRTRDAFLRRIALREKIWVPSILGDIRTFDSARNVAPLAPKTDPAGNRVKVVHDYELDSTIEAAGRSQAGKGWIYV